MISNRKRRAQDPESSPRSYKQRRLSQSPERMMLVRWIFGHLFSTRPPSSSSESSSEPEISPRRSASPSPERIQWGRSLSRNDFQVLSNSPPDAEPPSHSTPKLLPHSTTPPAFIILSPDEAAAVHNLREKKKLDEEEVRNYLLGDPDHRRPDSAYSSPQFTRSPLLTGSTLQSKSEERQGFVQDSYVENIQPYSTYSSFHSSQVNTSSFSRGSTVQSKRPSRKSLYPRTKKHIDHKKFKIDVKEGTRQAIKMRSHPVIIQYRALVNPDFVQAHPMSLENYQILLNMFMKKSPNSLSRLQSPKISHPYYESELSMKRTIDNAKTTLNSPRPSVPFTPSFEQRRILDRKKDAEIEKLLQTLPDHLPRKEDQEVDAILRKRGVVAKFAREQVSDVDISRLCPAQWLNDEIINFYGAMILARSEANKENAQAVNKARGSSLLDVHYFSTFFWSKLTKEGYERGRLAKWTKKINLFSKDVILIPVNHNNAHWTAAAINFRQKRIESYDTMGIAKSVIFTNLRAYLDAEHRDKKKKPFDFIGWEDIAPEDMPQQNNGWDCGVFTCHFLEALSRGVERFAFAQRNMPYLRRRMIWEIGNSRLRDDYK